MSAIEIFRQLSADNPERDYEGKEFCERLHPFGCPARKCLNSDVDYKTQREAPEYAERRLEDDPDKSLRLALPIGFHFIADRVFTLRTLSVLGPW